MATSNSKLLAERIEKAIDAEITRRMGTVSNPVLRASIQDLLRDSVTDRIMTAITAVPPKAIDIAAAVEQSMNELASSVKNLKGTPALKGSFKGAGTSNDNGGKTSDSGSKTPARPTRTYSSGGKGGGYGGK